MHMIHVDYTRSLPSHTCELLNTSQSYCQTSESLLKWCNTSAHCKVDMQILMHYWYVLHTCMHILWPPYKCDKVILCVLQNVYSVSTYLCHMS